MAALWPRSVTSATLARTLWQGGTPAGHCPILVLLLVEGREHLSDVQLVVDEPPEVPAVDWADQHEGHPPDLALGRPYSKDLAAHRTPNPRRHHGALLLAFSLRHLFPSPSSKNRKPFSSSDLHRW